MREQHWVGRAELGFSLLLAIILLTSCAYSFRGSNLPPHIKTIGIPNFENETLEPGLSQEVTAGVIDRFIKDGRLKLAPEDKANARIEARIIKYENKVYNYSTDQSPRDYIVVLTVAVTMRDQVKNRDLWKDDNMTRTATYVPDATGDNAANEEAARKNAIESLAGDVVTRTMEQW
jgi:hypothetical protein